MADLKEYVVTLTAWAIIAGDITVDAETREQAAEMAREAFEDADWPIGQGGDAMTPVGDVNQPVAVDCIYEQATGDQHWPDEDSMPAKFRCAAQSLAALRQLREAVRDRMRLHGEPVEWAQAALREADAAIALADGASS